VEVSTVLLKGQRKFQTAVAPVVDGEADYLNSIVEEKRTFPEGKACQQHRYFCQQFDRDHREFKYVQIGEYEPV